MSEYMYGDLGHQERATCVQANLSGNAANVFLVDSSNYCACRSVRSSGHVGLLDGSHLLAGFHRNGDSKVGQWRTVNARLATVVFVVQP